MGKSEVWLDGFALMNSCPVIRLAVQKKKDATIPSGSALQAGEVPDLRIIAGNVADARVRRAGPLDREWSRAVRNEKVVHGRIEAPTPVRLPTIVRRHIWHSPPSEDGLGYAS